MLDHRIKQRLEALGYAVDATELGYYTTHHGQLLETDGDFSTDAEDAMIGTGVRERAALHRTWDGMAWNSALKHSKTYYLVLTSRRLGTKFDVHRGGMILPCRTGLSYAGAITFIEQEQAAGRCVQIVTQEWNGQLQEEPEDE